MALFGLFGGKKSWKLLDKKYAEAISDGLRHKSSLAGRRMVERKLAKRR